MRQTDSHSPAVLVAAAAAVTFVVLNLVSVPIHLGFGSVRLPLGVALFASFTAGIIAMRFLRRRPELAADSLARYGANDHDAAPTAAYLTPSLHTPEWLKPTDWFFNDAHL